MQLLKLTAAAVAIILVPCCLCRVLPTHQAWPPAPCCSPDQWEAGYGLLTASQPFTSGSGSISLDYTNQLLATSQTIVTPDGKTSGQHVLLDGNSQNMYILDLNSKQCSVSTISSVERICLPAYFNYTATVTLGDAAQQFSGFVFQSGSVATGFVSVAVTSNQCAPVSVTTIQTLQVGIVQSFYNFTLGIKDRSVFNVPPECKQATEQDMIQLPRSEACALFGTCWLLN